MTKLTAITFLVPDNDDGINFFIGTLAFTLDDTNHGLRRSKAAEMMAE